MGRLQELRSIRGGVAPGSASPAAEPIALEGDAGAVHLIPRRAQRRARLPAPRPQAAGLPMQESKPFSCRGFTLQMARRDAAMGPTYQYPLTRKHLSGAHEYSGVKVAVENALTQSEGVEVKVHEAAAELVAVNDALAEEVDERHRLEQQLSRSDAALTQSRASLRKVSDSALHDGLTGLANLTLFNDRLGIALAQAERHSWRFAVMFIDLDGFKGVNDTYGHDVGDRVLKTTAQRLKSIVRKGDTVSRRSGDEFLFLMLKVKDDANVMALASRIATELGQACDVDGQDVRVSASVGIAVYPEDGHSAAELLRSADMRCTPPSATAWGPLSSVN